MSCDSSRINSIETNLQINPSNVSTNDLIYYLQCNTNNTKLNSQNLTITEEYLKQIDNSYSYENIFINKSNLMSIYISIIGLLLPFYFSFPRFYKMGFALFFIGIFSFLNLFSKIRNLYSQFFPKIELIYLIVTVVVYIIFFICMNKLNHISLFFISAVITYLILNYILRLILTTPLKNRFINYSATMNNNKNYTEYNQLLETACYQIIDRYKLNLPSGNMLYSYLSEFDIGENQNKISDFLTNFIAPFISIGILYLLGNFLNNIKYDGSDVNLFPIIGFFKDSVEYFTCQANYILPKELNVNLLIFDVLEEYNFNEDLYRKFEKALLRISYELLEKYNPKFKKLNLGQDEIISKLKYNDIYIRIKTLINNNKKYKEVRKLLKMNNIPFNKISETIDKENIPFKSKKELHELLQHINNTLEVINGENKTYENDSSLAQDILLDDKNIDKEYIQNFKTITDKFIKQFRKKLDGNNGILYGYDYNIITYSLLNDKIRIFSNKIFKFIIGLLSTWLLFAKPIGTPWLISSYIFSLKNTLKSNNLIMKYFLTGLDRSYFEDKKDFIEEMLNKISMPTKILSILLMIIVFIILLPLFYFYNSITFGLTLSPSWYNFIYQLIFIINILGNMFSYGGNSKNLLKFNIIFWLVFIFIISIISLITYFIKK
jgi:hypothetical protein